MRLFAGLVAVIVASWFVAFALGFQFGSGFDPQNCEPPQHTTAPVGE